MTIEISVEDACLSDFPGCVTLGKSPTLSGPRVLQPPEGDNKSCLSELSRNQITSVVSRAKGSM